MTESLQSQESSFNLRQFLGRAEKFKRKIPVGLSCLIILETIRAWPQAPDLGNAKAINFIACAVVLGRPGFNIKVTSQVNPEAAIPYGYLSPQTASGETRTERDDIFTLGTMFFELLSQRCLFASDDDMRTIALVIGARVPRPSKYNPDVSPIIDQITLRMLAKNREDRFQSLSELYHAMLEVWAKEKPLTSHSEAIQFFKELELISPSGTKKDLSPS